MDGRIRLIRGDERRAGQATGGMVREEAVATERMWAGLVQMDPGALSGWHHHGDYESAIYVVTGTLRMESGPGGTEVADAGPGEFLFVPKEAIHRESNPASVEGTAVVVRSGAGQVVFDVDGPEEA